MLLLSPGQEWGAPQLQRPLWEKGRLFLESLSLRPCYQLALGQDLALLNVLDCLIQVIEAEAQASDLRP